MSRYQEPFQIRFRLLLPLVVTPVLLAASLVAFRSEKFLAQQSPPAAPTSVLPSSLPGGTTIKVDGSNSMTVINEALKRRFEEKFPGTKVDLASRGTDEAIQALLRGELSLAAVGRPLTQSEKAQGLVEKPISREKVAIIVGSENPFKGNITSEQFAKIFRGEITNWSEVGGPAAPIRLVDRPESSDTRRAISQYPVFRSAPFKAATGATQIPQDDTNAVVDQLGKDGISYAIASQVQNRANVRILPLHNTLPDDPRYPFSQPRGYVYKGSLDPGSQAYLIFATSRPGQEVVESAKQVEAAPPVASPTTSPEATASPVPAPTTAPTAPAADTSTGASPWWWLLLPLLGIPLLWWLFKDRGGAAPVAAVAKTANSRIILTPRNCKNAYAYWELTDQHKAELRRHGGERSRVRLYDVTDVADMDRQAPHTVEEFPLRETDQDLHLPIARDNRDYIAELGYHNSDGNWVKVARSEYVRVPACTPTEREQSTVSGRAAVGGVAAAGAAAAGAALAHSVASGATRTETSRLILVPRNSREGYAYWEVPDAHKAALKQQGGEKLMLRLHDVTGIDPAQQAAHSVYQYECNDAAQDKHITLPVVDGAHEPHGTHTSDREYLAELGYVTADNRWLSLAKSDPVSVATAAGSVATGTTTPSLVADDVNRVEAGSTLEGMGSNVGDRISGLGSSVSNWAADARTTAGATLAGGAAAVAGAGAAAYAWADRSRSTSEQSTLPEQAQDCRIILVPLNSQDAYAYWEVADTYKQTARNQGGRRLALRIHDATNLDIDREIPHSTDVYNCLETEQDRHVKVSGAPNGVSSTGRDYIAELGYFTDDNRWIRVIRSFHVRVPAEA